MKRIVSLLIVLTVFALSSSTLVAYADDRTEYINVYNWGEYISDGADDSLDVNKAFEEATGIKVNYTNYTSNEDLYAKLKSGGSSYDIIIPSDYMIARMIAEDMIQKIDVSKLENYSNISDEYKNLYFDPNNEYSVPYNAGMVGLIYNKTMVQGTPDSWSILWDEQYADKILMINNPRDAFAIAQFLLGIDINSEDEADWQRAAEKLAEQKPLVRSYVMDEVFNMMESGEAALVPYYAGDFLTMRDNNPDLDMVFPKEGTNIFVDSICIPKSAGNVDGAMKYIDFLLSEEIALANAEYLYYTSPNKAVLENEEYSLKDDPYVYPSEEAKRNTEYFHNLDRVSLDRMNTLWDGLKIEGNNYTGVYVGIAVAVAAIGAVMIVRTVKKKKQNKYIDET